MRKLVVVRHGVLAGVGAAAAAALFTTAPIASADDTPALSVDDIAVPAAAVAPTLDGYENEFTIGEGGTEVTYTTTYDGVGSPVTTQSIETLRSGDDAYGYTERLFGDFTTATNTLEFSDTSGLFETTSAGAITSFQDVPFSFDILPDMAK
jgi:hypothetical protein